MGDAMAKVSLNDEGEQGEEAPEEKKTLVESMKDGSMLESVKETATDKKFLGGAGIGFLAGTLTGAGITHVVHTRKQKKEEEERKKKEKEDRKKDKKKKKKAKKRRGSSSSFSSCSSSSDSDSGGRYSVGTTVWTNWAGWEYSGTIVRYDSRNNTYHIVWEDGDESEWSERRVRRSRMKRGL